MSAGRIGRALLAALAIGILLALVMGLALPNRLYTALGESLAPTMEPGLRPLVVGIVVVAAIGIVLGLIGALRSRSSVVLAVIGGLVAGVLIGAFSAISFEARIGVGIGIASAYVAWMAILGADVARTGIDTDALKARFYPTQTIETSKETLEWLQKRMPPGIG